MDDDEQIKTTTNDGKKSADGVGLSVRRAVSSDAGGTRVVLRINKLSA